MGLFDGPVMSFATKFCKYLDVRCEQHIEDMKKADENKDAFAKMRHAIVYECLQEITAALRNVAGIEE